MIRLDKILTAGAAVALAMGTAAIAQTYGASPAQPAAQPSAPPSAMSGQTSDPMNGAAPAASASANGMNASATVGAGAPQSDGVQTVQQGNATLVTNGPVPDTPANRAKYGKPMSRTGRMTRPAGN